MSAVVQKNDKLLDHKSASVSDFYQLMKPRVMSLVIFTALVGYICGYTSAENVLNPYLSIIGIFAIALGAGSAGALNQWYDRDIDFKMERTKNRPIPQGKIEPTDAFAFGLLGSILSVMIIGLSINWFAGFFLCFTIIFYAFFYTVILKRYTDQNIVVGGASGAFPPMIGFICATGNLTLETFILFGIIFLWTPPHFWSLALKTKMEYRQANIPMLPNTRGDKITKIQILMYSTSLVLFSTILYFLDYNSILYLIFSLLLGVKFIHECIKLLIYDDYDERKVFNFSIIYLFLIYLIISIDKILTSFI